MTNDARPTASGTLDPQLSTLDALLTPYGCRNRRERLWAALDPAPDWLALHAPRSLAWLVGFWLPPFSYRTQNAGAILLLGSGGSSTLVADNLLRPYAEQAYVDEIVAPAWYDGRHSAPPRADVLAQAAREWMQGRHGRRVGADAETPASLLRGLEVADLTPALHRLQRQKAPDEVAALRESARAGEAGFAAAEAGVLPGMTELEAFALVQEAAARALGEPALVYGDFASGPRTVGGGGPPTQRVIEAGDLFLLDFSVVVRGYRADFANTFVVGGAPTPEQRELAALCVRALEVGEQRLRAGAACREVDAAVRHSFEADPHGRRFTHHTGHGLGLGHPDPPYIVPESDDTLLAGDVVTLEPGLYVEGVGGMRFERNYLITETGCELLTHHHIGLDTPR